MPDTSIITVPAQVIEDNDTALVPTPSAPIGSLEISVDSNLTWIGMPDQAVDEVKAKGREFGKSDEEINALIDTLKVFPYWQAPCPGVRTRWTPIQSVRYLKDLQLESVKIFSYPSRGQALNITIKAAHESTSDQRYILKPTLCNCWSQSFLTYAIGMLEHPDYSITSAFTLSSKPGRGGTWWAGLYPVAGGDYRTFQNDYLYQRFAELRKEAFAEELAYHQHKPLKALIEECVGTVAAALDDAYAG